MDSTLYLNLDDEEMEKYTENNNMTLELFEKLKKRHAKEEALKETDRFLKKLTKEKASNEMAQLFEGQDGKLPIKSETK